MGDYKDNKGELQNYSNGIGDFSIPNTNSHSKHQETLQEYQIPQHGPQPNRPPPKVLNINNDSLTDEQRAMYESILSTWKPVMVRKQMQRYKCQKCSKEFKNYHNLSLHTTRVHSSEESAVICHICDKTFKNKQYLYMHRMNKHYSESEKCYCQFCLQEFRTRRALHMHVKKIHPNNWNRPKVTCPECGKELSALSKLRNHIDVCHRQVKDEYNCHICYKIFKCLFNLNRHLRIHHQPVETHQPAEIHQPVETHQTAEIHQPVETHPCLFCLVTFKSRRQMKLHISNIHSPLEAKVTCLECLIKLKNNRYLKHLQVYSSLDKKVKCDLCDKFVHFSFRLEKHENIVHRVKPKIRCEKCNIEFSYAYNLKRHYKTIHVEVDKSNYSHECDQCGKTFKVYRYLKKHIQRHEEQHFKRIAQLVKTVMDDGNKVKAKTNRISRPRKECEQVTSSESETEKEEEEVEDTAYESEFSNGVFYGVTNLVLVVDG